MSAGPSLLPLHLEEEGSDLDWSREYELMCVRLSHRFQGGLCFLNADCILEPETSQKTFLPKANSQ